MLVCMSLAVIFGQGWFCASKGIWQCLETLLVVTAEQEGLASTGCRPGMLLNLPQHTGQPCQQRVTCPKRQQCQDWETPLCGVCAVLGIKSRLTLVTPWTAAHHTSLSMGFPRQEYHSGLPFPSSEGLLIQRSNPCLLHCRQIYYQWTREAKNVGIFL